MDQERVSLEEVASVLGISKSTLRYWESLGLITSLRGENNYRCYAPRDIVDIDDVRLLRKVGVPLRDIPRLQHFTCSELEDFYLGLSDQLGKRIAGMLEAQRELGRRAGLVRMVERLSCCDVEVVGGEELGVPWGIAPFDIRAREDYVRYQTDPHAMRYALVFLSDGTAPRDGWILEEPPAEEERLLWDPCEKEGQFARFLLKARADDVLRNNLAEVRDKLREEGFALGDVVARYLTDVFDDDWQAKVACYQAFGELLPLP